MAIVSDGGDVYAAVADMFVEAILMGTSLKEVFIPLQTYRHFLVRGDG